jgi:hypothetical protein
MRSASNIGIGLALSLAGAADADVVLRAANSATTSSTLVGGDRRLDALGFVGSPTQFGDAHFSVFGDGLLANNLGTFLWNDPIPRDMTASGNSVWSNPDRAVGSTPYSLEGSGAGTLAEVFGTSLGFRNMSYLIDAEDNRAWFMDLLFHTGYSLLADGDGTTVELAVLERGGNSDFRIYGIRADASLTEAIFVPRSATGAVGWSLRSLEISNPQPVHGVGISVPVDWNAIVGLRIEALSSYNGPDIVGVAAMAVIPAAPAIAPLLFIAGPRRRRQ